MDVARTLAWFERWHAKHRDECGATKLHVSFERGESATRVVLECPVCANTISGLITHTDLPQVELFFAPGPKDDLGLQ
jgi:hypothetical protein